MSSCARLSSSPNRRANHEPSAVEARATGPSAPTLPPIVMVTAQASKRSNAVGTARIPTVVRNDLRNSSTPGSPTAIEIRAISPSTSPPRAGIANTRSTNRGRSKERRYENAHQFMSMSSRTPKANPPPQAPTMMAAHNNNKRSLRKRRSVTVL